jgi:hypothetical protein
MLPPFSHSMGTCTKCPLMALSGHVARHAECLLPGIKGGVAGKVMPAESNRIRIISAYGPFESPSVAIAPGFDLRNVGEDARAARFSITSISGRVASAIFELARVAPRGENVSETDLNACAVG